MLCLGTDLVDISRLRRIYHRYGMAFFKRLLTPRECAYCEAALGEGKSEKACLHKLAARLAAKEATAKALKTGLNGLGWGQGIDWQEVEVVSLEKQAPVLMLSGKALSHAETQGITQWAISLAHDGDYAMATVIGI